MESERVENALLEMTAGDDKIIVHNSRQVRDSLILNLKRNKERNVHWDLSDNEHWREVRKRVITSKPMMVVGNPLTVTRSNVSENRCRVHLERLCSLYRMQTTQGRYFRHDNIKEGESWRREEIGEILECEGVQIGSIGSTIEGG